MFTIGRTKRGVPMKLNIAKMEHTGKNFEDDLNSFCWQTEAVLKRFLIQFGLFILDKVQTFQYKIQRTYIECCLHLLPPFLKTLSIYSSIGFKSLPKRLLTRTETGKYFLTD